MSISLAPEVEELLNKKVRSGQYGSASDVVREALRLLDQQETDYAEWRSYVQHKIEKGLAQADAGQCISLEELEQRMAKRREKYQKP